MKIMDYDVAVAGAGLAGLALACSLTGTSVALVARDLPSAPPSDGFDARVYAISPANVVHLERLGVWQRIPATCRTPVYGMQIHGDDGRSVLGFDAYEAGVPALAWIVEDSRLQAALFEGVSSRPDVSLLIPAMLEEFEADEGGLRIRLGDGRRLDASLLVGADGAASRVRVEAGMSAIESDYGQTAVVANFHTGRPHHGMAYQWFQGGPVLALLPLPGDAVSMVWSLPQAQAQALLEAPRARFEASVLNASLGVLGSLDLAGAPRGFPLRRLRVPQPVSHRVALIGDAAHVVHPLAGQGMNLGLQDARTLADVLSRREPGRDPGDGALLRRYARARAEDVRAMDRVVDGLFRLFGGAGIARALRNPGLAIADRMPMLKGLMVRRAMS
jgi:2-octaprenylphenol hydroxylase